jgi:hypothetical protein
LAITAKFDGAADEALLARELSGELIRDAESAQAADRIVSVTRTPAAILGGTNDGSNCVVVPNM